MDKPLYDTVLDKLEEAAGEPGGLKRVAADTDTPYQTITRILRRKTKDHSVALFDKLHRYFHGRSQPSQQRKVRDATRSQSSRL